MTIKHRSSGQALVESAVSLLIFLLLTIGVVDTGRAVWSYNTVSLLAREGARYATIPSHSTADIKSFITAKYPTVIGATPGPSDISVVRGVCGDPSHPAQVTVHYAFAPASFMIASLWGGGSLPLASTSQMYVELGSPGGCAA